MNVDSNAVVRSAVRVGQGRQGMQGAAVVGNRRWILAATLLATFLTAMETTVVSTALPTVIGELQGVQLYAWVFSAYLLTSTATVPLYGRLADMIGRKPIFIIGVVIFLIGSVLSGAATSMPLLILFRAVQGLGAGAVQPIVFTIVGDLFSLEERARVQGFFSAVWGSSSLAGPALGAIITETIGWRWIFYINLPFGIAAVAILIWALHEGRAGGKHRIDYAGAATLTVGVTVTLLGLLGGFGGGGGIKWSYLLGGLAILALFVFIETRVPEPVLPLALFRDPFIAIPCLIGLVIGLMQFGIPSYVPLFMQGVQFGTAGDAAKVLVAISGFWTVAAFLSPRLLIRFGFRAVALGGMLLNAAGAAILLAFRQETPLALIFLSLAIIGFGLGFAANSTLLASQNAVGWDQRGVVTASVQFTRTMGGTIGVAVLGAVLNARLVPTLRAAGTADVNALLEPASRAGLGEQVLTTLRGGLASSLLGVYAIMLVVAVCGVLFAFFIPAKISAPTAAVAEPVASDD
jgi:EmrB/QacA subfamily drug resistance transporter